MKNWITRLFGGASDAAPDARPGAVPETLPGPAPAPAPAPASRAGAAPRARSTAPGVRAPDPDAGSPPRLELPFWRWLCDLPATDPAGPPAAGPGARMVMEELARLARAPGEAADLVPRVPEVIPRLLRSLRDEGVSGADMARQVAQDAVMVAEVIREANSPFHRPAKPVRTVDAALLVLGQNGLRMLLARVAFRPIMGAQAGRFARLVAPRLWQHSERCAGAGALLAPGVGADPFEAYLAGLMIDVGLIVAFRLLDRLQESGPAPCDPAWIAAVLAGARQLSARIALHWELPPPIAAAILRAGEPEAQPLAQALDQADHLAKLRLLLDHGVLALDDPLVAGLDGQAARVLARLAPEPG